MSARGSVKARFALLTIGRLLLGAGSLYLALETYMEAAGAYWPLQTILFLAIGLSLMWLGTKGLVALFFSKSEATQSLIVDSVAEIDSRAPSGLKPLWLTLAVLLGIFVICLIWSGIRGTA